MACSRRWGCPPATSAAWCSSRRGSSACSARSTGSSADWSASRPSPSRPRRSPGCTSRSTWTSSRSSRTACSERRSCSSAPPFRPGAPHNSIQWSLCVTSRPWRMAVTEETLPRWDLSPFFPGLDSREFSNAHEGIGAGVARLTALYDQHDVRAGEPVELDKELLTAFEEVIDETNALQDHLRLVNAYLYGFVTTDARDDQAAALQSQLQAQAAPSRVLSSRFAEWVARLGAERLIEASQLAADHAWPLRKAEFAATHQMTEAEEGLAA